MNKVIEILEYELGKIKDTGQPTSSGKELLAWNPAGMARHIFSRIAREFPEEEILTILRRIYHHVGMEAKNWLPSYAIEEIKHLWQVSGLDQGLTDTKDREGTEGVEITLPEYRLRLWPRYKKSKPGCPTCGGSGEVPIPRESMEQENKYWKPCHDCDGTGERRKGERRRTQYDRWKEHIDGREVIIHNVFNNSRRIKERRQ